MADTLTALDATFLELEQRDGGALMSIGGSMIFDPRPDGHVPTLDEVRASIRDRLGAFPRYAQRLSSPHVGGFSWPEWVGDERFDIDNHVGHATLPEPGGDAELHEWMAEFFSHPLDRARPLWTTFLLDGLEQGRWALVNKTHHCLLDGVGSVGVLEATLQPGPDPVGGIALPPRPKQAGRLESVAAHAPQPLAQATAAGVHAVRGGLHAALHPSEAWVRSRALAELMVRDELVGAPRTSLNVPIGQGRRFAAVRAPLDELKELAHALGGSVNDAVLAACTTGLRELLLERGESLPAHGLRAMVPVNLRAASERLALGNKVSSLFVELPVAEPVAQVRFGSIVRTTQRLKDSDLAAGSDTFVELAGLAPPALHAALARTAYATRLFNVTITNVPGPRQPMYGHGARLREVFPVVPLAAAHTVGIAAFSYDGRLTFGLGADRASTPDLEVLAAGIEQGIDELRGLVDGL
ncbi:MAG TPA: wax ester/triacylglycerol synthase family O-acyltransferase [Solirubrobacteraceae bacterium]